MNHRGCNHRRVDRKEDEHMHAKTNIMGVEVDILSQEYLRTITEEYLSNDRLNIYFLLTGEIIEAAEKDEEFRKYLEVADLLLPGEEHIISLEQGEEEFPDIAIGYTTLLDLAKGMSTEKVIFFLCQDKNVIRKIENYTKRYLQNFKVQGYYSYEDHLGDEQIINSINAVAPDIIISTLPTPLQEKWITEYRTQVNAKLYIGMGGVMDAMIKEFKEPPNFIKKLHLVNWYNRIRKNRTNLAFRSRIFKHKVEQYNNKKGEDDNGTII